MYQFLRHRRAGVALLTAGFIFVLFHFYTLRSVTSTTPKEIVIPDEVSTEDLPYAPDHVVDLYSSEPPAHKHSVKWFDQEGIPETRIFAHIPGFTVIENLYSVNGTPYMVTEYKGALPAVKNILSAWAEIPGGHTLVDVPTDKHFSVIDKRTALRLFGLSARELRGTTWLSNNPIAYTDEGFTLEFLRTHYMQEHRAHFNESLLPPSRVLFPKVSNTIQHTIPGLSSIPRLLFPTTMVGFKEDWDDYVSAHRPIIFQTVVLVDRAAAARNPAIVEKASTTKVNLEINSPLSGFRSIDSAWWSFWRSRMFEMLSLGSFRANDEHFIFGQPVITYIPRQEEGHGARLYDEHHERLVNALHQLARDHEYEVNIINPRDLSFLERMKIISRTTILMSPTGSFLNDAMWMLPIPTSLVIEFFPDRYFSPRQHIIAEAVGIPHIGWRGSEVLAGPDQSLPPSIDADTVKNMLETPSSVDARALIQFIVNRLEKNQGEEEEDM